MVDITITPANVKKGTDAQTEQGIAGATITAGQAVWRDTGNKYQLADNNHATTAARTPRGIALHAAFLDQPLQIQRSGDITIGATVTAGAAFYLSDTPGGICPVADVGSGENVSLIGLAKSTTVLTIDIQAPGVTL